MPKYRSITLSVMSQWEMKQFPEFPHPDSVHYVYRGPGLGTDGSILRRSIESTTTIEPSRKSDRAEGRVPSVSCYIPSVQGVRFFFKYTIEPPYPNGQFFYFKLFMNGRHICSWGINPRTHPRGQVLRALFEAEEKWNLMEDSGKVLRNGVIESRPFLFAQDTEGICAADDGGLIEIRVFRAKGRRRRLPNLERFRPQDQYGINLPSAGLVDKPQDTKFYDWILIDRKDEPYATFLFHYRSWEHLQSLQLIPALHPRTLLKPSNSFALLAGVTGAEDIQKCRNMDECDITCEYNWLDMPQDSPPGEPTTSVLCNSSTFDEMNSVSEYGNHQVESTVSDSPSKGQRDSQANLSLSDFSVCPAVLSEWSYERPLPKLPKPKSSFDHSRRSSTSSNAPSITPSLSSWFERDLSNPSPEPVIEVAAAVPLHRTTSQITSPGLSGSFSVSGADAYDQGLSSQSPSSRFEMRYFDETDVFSPDIIIRKSIPDSPRSITRLYLIPADSDDGDGSLQACRSKISTSPSESEWLNRPRIPSPVKRNSKHKEKALPPCPLFEEGFEIGEPVVHGVVGHKSDDNNWNRYSEIKEGETTYKTAGKRDASAGSLHNTVMYSSPEWI